MVKPRKNRKIDDLYNGLILLACMCELATSLRLTLNRELKNHKKSKVRK
jgi:hypothetical protein